MSRAPLRIACALLALWLLAGSATPTPAHAEDEAVRPHAATGIGAARMPESLRAWIEGLEPDEQRIVAAHLRGMRPAQRRRFLRRWEHANPLQLERIQARMQRGIAQGLESMRAQREARARALGIDPERLESNRRAWQRMGGDQQQRMRARLQRFAALDADQQEAVVAFQFADRSESERAQILQKLRSAAQRLSARAP